MTNALLSDVEARAERRRTRTRADHQAELATHAWHQASTATSPADRLRWLQRAHRIAPEDGLVATTLAGALLAQGALREARDLFQSQTGQHGATEAWSGLAACAHLLHDPAHARAALQRALRQSVPTPLHDLLRAIAPPQGWCGLTTDGILHAALPSARTPHPPPVTPTWPQVRLDDTPLALVWHDGAARLPRTWRTAHLLTVDGPDGPLLGSPLPIRNFAALEGFVEAVDGALTGWAWHPADPAARPTLRIEGDAAALTLRPTAPTTALRTTNPYARPRRFTLAAPAAAALGTTLRITGPDRRHLLGSPIDPRIEARPAFIPVWTDAPPRTPSPAPTAPPVDVVIPVHGAREATLACLAALLPTTPRTTRIIVVDDASPDPALAAALDALARRRRIHLLRLPRNRGFPGAANAGIAAAAPHDVILLNSDTLVPPRNQSAPTWLDRLRAAAYATPETGTATPFTNDGTILGYPSPAGGNPVPGLQATAALDALAWRANRHGAEPVPVGVGFCLYLRRDCLDQVGTLREDIFAQGYGEENDLCLRARAAGWRNVAATGVFVAHLGAASFGSARTQLIRRNARLLERLHPGYDALVAAHAAADPLAPARLRMDALRWAQDRNPPPHPGAIVLTTHAGGGGVDRVVADRARAAAAQGRRPIILRPARTPSGPGIRVEHPGAPPTPNLVFPMPAGLPALARLLRPDRVARVELHHTLGHHPAIAGLAALLGAEPMSVVHDYARLCPRIALVTTTRRYCGEPDLAGCEACVADLGSLLEDDPPLPTLLARSSAELTAAARIVAPSTDAARRLRRHFPATPPDRFHITPWEDDSRLPPLDPPPTTRPIRIAVVGAIGTEKGFDVLLACVRDARSRRLPLEFVVVGYTADDARLLAAGPAFVTGEYTEDEAVPLIRAQAAHLAFIPSVWPETWCFALGRAWQAGLAAAVFDLGAQAERVRNTGRGWLLPLALEPPAVNDALLRLAKAPPPCHVRRD